MANLNKVMLIGRLTRDPEVRTFSNGGKVAKFGFAVNNRKKNASTGQWEDEPVFLDCEAFNRGDFGKLADLVEQYLSKGRQVFLEGHLQLDQWTSKEGEKRQKLKIVVDQMQFLESAPGRGEGGSGENVSRAPRPAAAPRRPEAAAYSDNGGQYDAEPEPMEPRSGGGGEEEIPF